MSSSAFKDSFISSKFRTMPLLSYPSAVLANIGVCEMLADADLQARCLCTAAWRWNCAAVWGFMNLSLEAGNFGADLATNANGIPYVARPLINSVSDICDLKIPALSDGDVGVWIDAAKRTCKACVKPFFGYLTGTYSVAWQLLGAKTANEYCYEKRAYLVELLEKIYAFQKSVLSAYVRAGASGVLIAEPLAAYLPESEFIRDFSCKYISEFVREFQSGNFSIVYHNCGAGVENIASQIFKIGAAAYHFGNAVNLDKIFLAAPKTVAIMGNLDPVKYFCTSSPESVSEAVAELSARYGKFDNFILSSGCDIPPNARVENIDAFFAAAEEWIAV